MKHYYDRLHSMINGVWFVRIDRHKLLKSFSITLASESLIADQNGPTMWGDPSPDGILEKFARSISRSFSNCTNHSLLLGSRKTASIGRRRGFGLSNPS